MKNFLDFLKNFFKKKEYIESNFKGMKALEESNSGRNRKIAFIFAGIVIVVFIGSFLIKFYKVLSENTPEHIQEQDKIRREMTAEEGENAYFQSMATEKFKEQSEQIKKLQEEQEDRTNKLIADVNKKVDEALKKVEKEGVENKEEIKKLQEEIQGLPQKIEESNQKLQGEISKIVQDSGVDPKKNQETHQQLEELNDKYQALLTQLEDIKNNPSPKSIDDIKEGDTSLQPPSSKEKNEGKKEGDLSKSQDDALARNSSKVVNVVFSPPTKTMKKKRRIEVNGGSGQSQEVATLEVPMGMAEAILLTGGEAQIAGFNGSAEEATPVGLKLLTNMIVANDNFTQVEDCFLLGSTMGQLASNRAIIRLHQISCIYEDKSGKKYSAFGPIKGWVYDENSSLGVSGTLISRESKVIQTAIPMTLLQAGLDYVSNSQTNVFLDGNDLTKSLGSSFGSGFSEGAGKSIQKLLDYYMNYLDALSPTISFRAGRKITIMFKGGESISLKPYQDGGLGKNFLNLEDFAEKKLLVGDKQ